MNTSYDSNSTPKLIDQNKYIESLMDFSTPMSTISVKNLHQSNLTIINKLLQKFHEYKIHFSHTKTYLNSFDHHLFELITILNQLQNSLNNNSLLKISTDQLETRLLQMSIKREQIRKSIQHFNQSPIINQTLDDIIQQISPSISKRTKTNDYTELINAIKLSLNQKTNLIEHLHQEQNQINHRINNYHLKFQKHQQILLQLIEKIFEQKKMNEKSIENNPMNKIQFNYHIKQLNEFNKLHEEYDKLQDENRQLKNQAKDHIKILYHFINQTTE